MDFRIKNGIILIFLLVLPEISFSRDFSLGIGYSYLQAKQWDKAIQAYNISRPFIREKQPLVEDGITINSSYLFNSGRRVRHGVVCSYGYYSSSANNENLSNRLSLHLFKPGYMLHFGNLMQVKYLSVDVVGSALLGGLFRSVNQTPYFYDDKRAKALGVGGSIDIKCAYQCFRLNRRFALSPYVGAGYTPYFYSPGFESLINQTKQLTSKSSTEIISFEIGVMFSSKH